MNMIHIRLLDYPNTHVSRQLIHYLLEPVIRKSRQYSLPVVDRHSEVELNSLY
ncbi:MAG: hypothetical protein ABSA46_18610 [Thermodesulfovibrionales bacterium]